MTEAIPFATDAWVRRLGDECNKSQAYRAAAKNWEGDLYIVVEPEGQLEETVYMYLDLYHGECRKAFVPKDPSALSPEFWIIGPLSAWKEVAEKNMDPIKALLTRKLALKGNMAKIMRSARAAQALMNCSANFETEFPA
jgi:putative sterol carrier protein